MTNQSNRYSHLPHHVLKVRARNYLIVIVLSAAVYAALCFFYVPVEAAIPLALVVVGYKLATMPLLREASAVRRALAEIPRRPSYVEEILVQPMSYSRKLGRLGHRYPTFSTAELGQLLARDPAALARARSCDERRPVDLAPVVDKILAAQRAEWATVNYQFQLLALIGGHLIWLIFVPKPSFTRALIKWVFGLDVS